MAKRQQTAPAEQVELHKCACGCGLEVKPKSTYRMGHDAKLKGELLRQLDAGSEEAGVRLMSLGWKSNDELEARRDKAEAKAEAKAQREAARSAKAAGADAKTESQAA